MIRLSESNSFTPDQIEEILRMYFDVVGKRQYVGMRYVPIFGRKGEDSIEWDKTGPYEPLTVVTWMGGSYVSRRFVPAGIEIENTEYWAYTFSFDAQVEQYREEVLRVQGMVNELLEDIAQETSAREDDIAELRAYLLSVLVPFPVSGSKLGTSGQVLSTNADGTTTWVNPVVPSDAQAAAVITAWLNDHPEATTTVQDDSITDTKLKHAYGQLISNALKTTTTIVNNDYADAHSEYSDVDTFPINTCILVNGATADHLAHKPVDSFAGYIFTINRTGSIPQSGNPYNRDFSVQIAWSINTNNTSGYLWIRTRYNAWSPWKNVGFIADNTIDDAKLSHSTGNMISNALRTFDTIVDNTYADNHLQYSNVDTFPNNRTVLLSAVNSTHISNLPTPAGTTFSGYVTTMYRNGLYPPTGDGYNRQFTVQVAQAIRVDSTNTPVMYVRSKYAAWTDWQRVALASEIPEVETFKNRGAFRGLKDFTVLGDSISVSLAYPSVGQGITVKSWAKHMSHQMGADCDVYASGGQTTGGTIAADYYATATANAGGNQFAIVCLGINDLNNDIAEATFTSNYTQIVEDLLDNHDFVLCASIPACLKSGDQRAVFNTAIQGICTNTTGAFYVNVDAYNDKYKDFAYLGHMSSVGYACLAEYMSQAIDDTLGANTYFTHCNVDQ